MDNLLDFIGGLIEENGGALEWADPKKCFQALLPDDLHYRLSLPESIVSIGSTDYSGDQADIIPIGFGTELLERAITTAIETGQTASVRMPIPSLRKQPDLDPGDCFSFLNATFKEKGDHKSWLDYWLWSFDVSAAADDSRNEIQYICISSEGAGCPGLAELILEQAADWEELKVKDSEFSQERLDTLFLIACDRVLQQIDQGMTDFKASITRHHVRDIRLIDAYFQELRNEMEEEIQRRNLEKAEIDIRRNKIKQYAIEKSRKISALKEKYRLRLTLRPLTLLLARLPVRRFDILIKRRKGERRINLVYNLLSRSFDPMACEACGSDTFMLGFCDDSLHLLCPACLSRYKKQKSCPRCRGNHPPTKIGDILRRLGMEKYAGLTQ